MYRLAWFESPNTRTANVIRRHPYQCGAAWNYVTARFFDVFKIPIVRGRGFTERDNAAGAGGSDQPGPGQKVLEER